MTVEVKPKNGLLNKEGLDKCSTILKSLTFDTTDASSLTPDLWDAFVDEVPYILSDSIISCGQSNPGTIKRVQRITKEFCEKVCMVLEDAGCVSEEILSKLLKVITTTTISESLLKQFPTHRKRIAKAVIIIWSTWSSEKIRVISLLTLYRLCVKHKKLLPTCIKLMYNQYKKSCHSISTHNIGQAALLLNGLVEIFSLQPVKGAEFGIRALRQMAILLKQSTKSFGTETFRKIFCWQIVSLLRFWAQLLASQLEKNAEGNPYKTLLFPFCNIITCLTSFQVAPRFFPFHFHCIAVASELSSRLGCFIPVTSCLLRIIKHVSKQPLHKLEVKKGAYDFVSSCKVPKSETITKGYLESIVDEAMYYLLDHLTKLCNSVTFPEHAEPIIMTLRDMIRHNLKIDRTLKKQIEGHLSKIVQQKKEIEGLRTRENLTPASVAMGKATATIPIKSQIMVEYIKSVVKIRDTKRKLLAERFSNSETENNNNDKDGDDDDGDNNNKYHKYHKSDKNHKNDKNDGIKSIDKDIIKSPVKKHKIKTENPPTVAKKSKPSKSSKKASPAADDDDDIVEDFVLED